MSSERLVVGADVLKTAEGSTEALRRPGAEVPPESESRACAQWGFPGTWEACAAKAEGGIDVVGRTRRMLAASEMEVGPPEPLCRDRLQTTASCVGQEPGW